jgi:hypothetical protein
LLHSTFKNHTPLSSQINWFARFGETRSPEFTYVTLHLASLSVYDLHNKYDPMYAFSGVYLSVRALTFCRSIYFEIHTALCAVTPSNLPFASRQNLSLQ